jgi:hypothetical protein
MRHRNRADDSVVVVVMVYRKPVAAICRFSINPLTERMSGPENYMGAIRMMR